MTRIGGEEVLWHSWCSAHVILDPIQCVLVYRTPSPIILLLLMSYIEPGWKKGGEESINCILFHEENGIYGFTLHPSTVLHLDKNIFVHENPV